MPGETVHRAVALGDRVDLADAGLERAQLLVSDTVARTILSPVEIPVGIITSLVGAPFFIYILLRKKSSVCHE